MNNNILRDKNMKITTQEPVLKDDALYIGDNGRVYHGRCSGMSARFTGLDISGQKVEPVTQYEIQADPELWKCERCE
jgi:hypothetical protein